MAITEGILPTLLLIIFIGFFFEIAKQEDEYAERKKRGPEDLRAPDDFDIWGDDDKELSVPVHIKDKSTFNLPKRSA